MIKYLISVIGYMQNYPLKKGDKFITWFRNCFYLNWQKPAKWNIDAYWLYKTVDAWNRRANDG